MQKYRRDRTTLLREDCLFRSTVEALRIVDQECRSCSDGHPSHGFNNATSANRKSPTLRVTSVKSCSIAMAAIMESIAGGLTPLISQRPTRRPHRSAVAASNDTMRPEKRSTVAAIKASNSAFREELATFSIPLRISPIVSTLKKKVISSAARAQATTRGSDRGPFASSEMTFVSSKKPLKARRRAPRRCCLVRRNQHVTTATSRRIPLSRHHQDESAARSRAAIGSPRSVARAW